VATYDPSMKPVISGLVSDRRSLLSTLVVGALLLATVGSVRAATVTVASVNFRFEPETRSVNVGDVVRWTFAGDPHTVTSGEPGSPDGRFDSGIKEAGGSYQVTFDSAGTFPYFCQIHPEQMVGTIVVTGATPTQTAASTPTPRPTARPTTRPTAAPTARPTARPTAAQTARPTAAATAAPATQAPSASPSGETSSATPSATAAATASSSPAPSASPAATPSPDGAADAGLDPLAVAGLGLVVGILVAVGVTLLRRMRPG